MEHTQIKYTIDIESVITSMTNDIDWVIEKYKETKNPYRIENNIYNKETVYNIIKRYMSLRYPVYENPVDTILSSLTPEDLASTKDHA